MDPLTIGTIGAFILVVLIFAGIPIAFAAGGVGLVGLMLLRDPLAMFTMIGGVPLTSAASYTLSVLPLYIAIGFLAYHAGLTVGAFSAAKAWFGRLPGGLATATIMANAGFAAVSGSSIAATSVFTQLALPEMEKAGIGRALAAGTVAVGGMLAALIPPSALLVVYAIIVDASVGKLLVAGLVPGAMSIVGYVLVLVVISIWKPEALPKLERVSFGDKIRSLKGVWGIFGVIGVILGGVYFGWMTPTESAAVAVGIILVMAVMNGMRLKTLNGGLIETIKTTAMIFTIFWGMLIFTRFLAFTGLPDAVTQGIVSLDVAPWMVMVGIVILYVGLGMLLDGLGMMLLTVPILHPAVVELGYDPIWYGIIVVKMVEIGLVTPPVGLNCFVVHGTRPDIPLGDVFKGVTPFLVVEAIMLAIIMIWPDIVLFLPNTMWR
ncbi:MAG: TRAP transporter large permease [Flavobacteriaceae bacterium]